MTSSLKKLYLFIVIVCFFQVNLISQNDTLSLENQYYLGKDLYYDRAYDQAKEVLKKAIEQTSDVPKSDRELVLKIYTRLARTEYRLDNDLQAIEYLDEALIIAQKYNLQNSVSYSNILLSLGDAYTELRRAKQAIFYFNQVIEIYKEKHGPESAEVGGIVMSVGLAFYKQGNVRKTEKYLNRALEIFKKSEAPNGKNFNRIYFNLANYYFDINDYEKAVDYGEKALKIKLLNYEKTHPSVPKYFSFAGISHMHKGNLNKGREYIEQSFELTKSIYGEDHLYIAADYNDLARFYKKSGDYQRALDLEKKALSIRKKTLSSSHSYVLGNQLNIGKLYYILKEYDQAIDYLSTVIEVGSKDYRLHKKWIASAQQNISRSYLKKGALEQALSYVQGGLENIVSDFHFQEGDFYKNPTLEKIQNESTCLGLLTNKSLILQTRYYKTKNIKDLEVALETSELTIELVKKIRKGYQSESAKIFINSEVTPIYQQGIEQAFELYSQLNDVQYLKRAFNISESSKASVLLQGINDQQALENYNITLKDQIEINTVAERITDLEENFSTQKDSLIRLQLKNEIFDTKIKYESLIRILEENNPAYYQLKYAPTEINADRILQLLSNKETALVQYFYTSQKLFTFVFSSQGLAGFQQDISFDLNAKILALRNNEVSSLHKTDSKTYIQLLNQLHDVLIKPILLEIKNSQNLIIIPHEALQYLSFETLCSNTETDDFRKLDYLIKYHNIHYAWSASLWSKKPKQQTKSSLNYLGFAPGFEDSEALTITTEKLFISRGPKEILTYSIPEILGANEYFPGETFIGSQATENQFLQKASKSKIIHLATHAIANEQNPLQSGFLFSEAADSLEDGFLSGLEIYNLDLIADLAVMSACNTGYGQLAEGEGVMSLGRAFMYAGCKSVITSLWLANDESTSTIMQRFYKYSTEGLSKDKALKQAKLDYLSQTDPLTAHPYFWANLVAVGDMTPLKPKSTHWIWMSILVFASIGLFLWRRRIQ